MLRRRMETNENHEARFRDLSVDRSPLRVQNGTGSVAVRSAALTLSTLWRKDIMWTKPEFTEMRFGFEVTMYIYNR
jgi:coenzyme PQQ precursor peptide PqqA